MKKIRIPGRIESSQFIPDNPRNWNNAMAAFNGKHVVVYIGKPTKDRTLPQNSYLWGVPYKIIAEETGSDVDSVHYEMVGMFLRESGGTIPRIKSTTKLSTIEFNEYVDRIIRWAAEFLGLYIPLPNEEEMWKSYESR